jgi:hypothetical protein
VAVERVADRLPEVRSLMAAEQRAFDAFVDAVAEHARPDAVVLDMFARRADGDDL